jgi:hypothetical protein
MSKKTLPSGAVLEINLAPFLDANSLNRAVAKELLKIKFDGELDLNDHNFIKDIICTAISSDDIMSALWNCFKRCTYNGVKMNQDTFENEDARGDYFTVCKEVLIENLRPFGKGLLSQFEGLNTETKA